MSVVLLYRVQRVDKTLENIITFYGWQDSFVRNIKNIQSYFILLRGDKKFDKKGNGNWFQIVKEPAGTKPSWASALTTQNHSGSSWIKKMFNNEYSQRQREIWIYFLKLTKTGDSLIQNRDTLAPFNAEVVFILRVVAVEYDVPGEDSDDDCDDEDELYWLVDCIIYNVVTMAPVDTFAVS